MLPLRGSARVRYDTVRRFAAFLKAEDGRHEAPPAGAFGRGRRPRPAPYLLTLGEIAAIMTAALALPPHGMVSSLTYHHLFGLLATTGLRISEAVALKRDDLTDEGLIVRRGKFGKSRLVPLHPSTRAALGRYLAARDRLGAGGDDLFVVKHGRAPTKTRVYCVFVRLARVLGIRGAPGTGGPRIHDLRHTFAIRSLEACAAPTAAVTRHMLALSTYIGHATSPHPLVPPRHAGADGADRRGGRGAVPGRRAMTALAPHLTAFLREHLPRERRASPATLETYAHGSGCWSASPRSG